MSTIRIIVLGIMFLAYVAYRYLRVMVDAVTGVGP